MLGADGPSSYPDPGSASDPGFFAEDFYEAPRFSFCLLRSAEWKSSYRVRTLVLSLRKDGLRYVVAAHILHYSEIKRTKAAQQTRWTPCRLWLLKLMALRWPWLVLD
ncbi:hypothetical protein NDU88_000562 [Pleurodeles waltl]|uniref:Uncharacterized protein n=1 Tax=Pleurodeles waltl TaxID=8319 RepID=A0AAV7SX17_PLEWA|nr:hypothetical protein NDU88_000562 [Pleurodeles waltl]